MATEFVECYKEYYERLYTLAFRMTGSKEKAEDVLQISFMNAYKAWNSFKGESSVYTWLYRIVVNTSKREWKKEQRLPVDRFADDQGITQEEAYAYVNRNGDFEGEVLTDRVRETCLQMFMNCLPAQYRIVYTLRAILQLSVKESAEILEMSESAIKVNLNRARKMLQDHFQGRCSLIKPGSLCRCRSFAQHVIDEHMENGLLDITVIRKHEKKATDEFHNAIKEIVGIDELFATTFVPLAFDTMAERVKDQMQEGNNPLLAR